MGFYPTSTFYQIPYTLTLPAPVIDKYTCPIRLVRGLWAVGLPSQHSNIGFSDFSYRLNIMFVGKTCPVKLSNAMMKVSQKDQN